MLRLMKELIGCEVIASDGTVGTVSDFLFGERDWDVQFVEVGVNDSERQVLIPAGLLERSNLENKQLPTKLSRAEIENQPAQDTTKLLSYQKMNAFDIEADDGDGARVDDCILDEDHWRIPYLVADTSNGHAGDKVILATKWVDGFVGQKNRILMDITKEEMGYAIKLEPQIPMNGAYEGRLSMNYGMPSMNGNGHSA